MPTYDFQCMCCQLQFEVSRPMAEAALRAPCPQCGSPDAERVYNRAPNLNTGAPPPPAEVRVAMRPAPPRRRYGCEDILFRGLDFVTPEGQGPSIQAVDAQIVLDDIRFRSPDGAIRARHSRIDMNKVTVE